MEQSGVVGLNIEGNPERITDFRDAPFCSQQVLVDMLGTELITPDVVRGWVSLPPFPPSRSAAAV
jgi:hypothetical protein